MSHLQLFAPYQNPNHLPTSPSPAEISAERIQLFWILRLILCLMKLQDISKTAFCESHSTPKKMSNPLRYMLRFEGEKMWEIFPCSYGVHELSQVAAVSLPSTRTDPNFDLIISSFLFFAFVGIFFDRVSWLKLTPEALVRSCFLRSHVCARLQTFIFPWYFLLLVFTLTFFRLTSFHFCLGDFKFAHVVVRHSRKVLQERRFNISSQSELAKSWKLNSRAMLVGEWYDTKVGIEEEECLKTFSLLLWERWEATREM